MPETTTRSKPYDLGGEATPVVVEQINSMLEELYALGVQESDIVDGTLLVRTEGDEVITARWLFTGGRIVLEQGTPIQGRNAGNTADIDLLSLLAGTLSIGGTGSTDLATLLLQANSQLTLAAGGVTGATLTPTAITTALPLAASIASVEAFSLTSVGTFIRQALHASSTLSPATLSAGSNNNYNPTNFATAFGIRLTGNATASTISGAVAPADGRLVVFWNVGTPDVLFSHEDTNSTDINRFLTGNSGTRRVGQNGYIAFWYDTTSNRWREFAYASGLGASGTYTPTLTNVTNLGASTAYACQWSRTGDVVTVSGKVDVDPTAAGNTQLGISLPVASAFAAQEQCGGTAAASGIAGQVAAVRADATNDRAEMVWIAVDITNQPMYFTFTYQIV